MGADAGVDAGGGAPQITAAQAQALAGTNAVGSTTSGGLSIRGDAGPQANITDVQAGLIGGANSVGQVTSTGAPITQTITANQAGLIAGANAVGRVTSSGDLIRKGLGNVTPGGVAQPDPTGGPSVAPVSPGSQPTAGTAPTPEPISQTPAPEVTPLPEIVAKAKPTPRRSTPLNQAGRRRNRFFAQRGRSSIQVNKPAGAGLSIRRSGVAGAF